MEPTAGEHPDFLVGTGATSCRPHGVTRPVHQEEIDALLEELPVTAHGILATAGQHMKNRAATYDKPEGERSMAATIQMFNALTGKELTEEQGWLLMACLKMVRAQSGDLTMDSYEDGAAYFALAGESAARNRG